MEDGEGFVGVNSTAALIDLYIKRKARKPAHSNGISMSAIGKECLRAAWYDFHWVFPPKEWEAKMLRLFESGEEYERRLLDWLEATGVEVQRLDDNTGKQIKCALASGFLRGKLDGRCYGLPEAPKTPHTVECKSHNRKSFDELIKKKLKEAKLEHWTQCQLYMHSTGDTKALYMAECKDTDRMYLEFVEYDAQYCLWVIARAEAVVDADVPPPKISDKPTHPRCKFCDYATLCHGEKFPVNNCRTCIFARPVRDGKANWNCGRWNKPISYDEQRLGCEAHLFIAELIPGEVIHFDEDANTVLYRLTSGTEWTDGNTKRS
jgi:hypothetical protein